MGYAKTKNKTPLDVRGKNLLALAVESTNIYMVRRILELNTIKLEEKDGNGDTVLFENNCFKYPDILKAIIDYEIDLNQLDSKGNSFLSYCISREDDTNEVFKVALENGADINTQSSKGRTIL